MCYIQYIGKKEAGQAGQWIGKRLLKGIDGNEWAYSKTYRGMKNPRNAGSAPDAVNFSDVKKKRETGGKGKI